MSVGRLLLAPVAETLVPPQAPFFSNPWGTSRFPTPLPAHEPAGAGR